MDFADDGPNPGICWDCRYADEEECGYYSRRLKKRVPRSRRKLYGLHLANRGKRSCKHHSSFTPEETWKAQELESFMNGFEFLDDEGDLLVGIHAPPKMEPGESWADYYARLVGRTLDEAWQHYKAEYEAAHPGVVL